LATIVSDSPARKLCAAKELPQEGTFFSAAGYC
jgi:hypothetical protein